jgi:hypothetical protein
MLRRFRLKQPRSQPSRCEAIQRCSFAVSGKKARGRLFSRPALRRHAGVRLSPASRFPSCAQIPNPCVEEQAGFDEYEGKKLTRSGVGNFGGSTGMSASIRLNAAGRGSKGPRVGSCRQQPQ